MTALTLDRQYIEYQDTTLNFAKRAWLASGMIYGRFFEDPNTVHCGS